MNVVGTDTERLSPGPGRRRRRQGARRGQGEAAGIAVPEPKCRLPTAPTVTPGWGDKAGGRQPVPPRDGVGQGRPDGELAGHQPLHAPHRQLQPPFKSPDEPDAFLPTGREVRRPSSRAGCRTPAIFGPAPYSPNDTFSLMFTKAGQYPYLCLLHPGMAGTVEVDIVSRCRGTPPYAPGRGRPRGRWSGWRTKPCCGARAGSWTTSTPLPHIAEAAVVRSTEAHARIVSVDVSAALAVPGVVGVLTGADVAALSRPFPSAIGRAVEHWAAAVDRGPLRRASRWRSSWPGTGTWPRTRPSWWTWSTSRCRWRRRRRRRWRDGAPVLHEAVGSNVVSDRASPTATRRRPWPAPIWSCGGGSAIPGRRARRWRASG